jgi:hypothetical protein
MRIRYAIPATFAVLFAAGCSDMPTSPDRSLAPSNAPSEARKTRQAFAFPVDGVIPGGTFDGTAQITSLALNAAGQLEATGVLNGTATVAGIATAITGQTFTTLAVITEGAGGVTTTALSNNTPGACDVLFLDLGPLSLDLLGLTVDLDEVVLDVNAVPGAGNLLGNLLCTVVHLLDGPGVFLQALENILDLINSIIGAIG